MTHAVLRRLAGGEPQSGPVLAARLRLTRTAVWKHVRVLRRLGVGITVEPRRGYCLDGGLELLERRAIGAAIPQPLRRHVSSIATQLVIDSTNRRLFERDRLHGQALLAEFQTAGRGRRGNDWLSPLGSGICLSFGWRFDSMPSSLPMLSLLAGAAALRALRRFGIEGVGLKWPNDLLAGTRKLGGILIESRGQSAGPHDVVLGIGLNVRLPDGLQSVHGQPITDLATLAGRAPSRNTLAGALLGEFADLLLHCAREQAGAWLDEWRRHDAVRGRLVRLTLPAGEVQGTALDIDDSGRLLLSVNGEVRRYGSGELRLRTA
jgi:BirA family biotin operon repressor/biotin-[acetyl-CoA-carboxylase] ligase